MSHKPNKNICIQIIILHFTNQTNPFYFNKSYSLYNPTTRACIHKILVLVVNITRHYEHLRVYRQRGHIEKRTFQMGEIAAQRVHRKNSGGPRVRNDNGRNNTPRVQQTPREVPLGSFSRCRRRCRYSHRRHQLTNKTRHRRHYPFHYYYSEILSFFIPTIQHTKEFSRILYVF